MWRVIKLLITLLLLASCAPLEAPRYEPMPDVHADIRPVWTCEETETGMECFEAEE